MLARQSRQPGERRDEARFFIGLPTLHDLEDLAHDDGGDQASGFLRRVPLPQEAVECLPGFRRFAVRQLVVDDLKQRGVQCRIRWWRTASTSFVSHRCYLSYPPKPGWSGNG